MENRDREIFIVLFREACLKCFGHELSASLSETESKQLSTDIFDRTGLVIGVKSIKNYSQFVMGLGRDENPSIASLDTLARFVMDAPSTTETLRKDREPHHPFWFQYKRRHLRSPAGLNEKVVVPWRWIAGVVFFFLLIGGSIFYFSQNRVHGPFVEDFSSIDDATLKQQGWEVISKDKSWWEKRSVRDGHIALYTLTGDNWSDSSNEANISNLMLKRIESSCFSAEIHFTQFVPEHNWQQAGLLLLEDTVVSSKGIRLSLAYNDFFGGYDQAPEIVIQAIASLDGSGFRKPEEFVHASIFRIDSIQKPLIKNNLSKSALRIEKTGTTFRFLYSTGPLENAAFKEVALRNFNIMPKYIGVIAIQGFVDGVEAKPVFVDKFVLSPMDCD